MAKRSRSEPTWLSRLVVDAIHNDQLREHGGRPGVRDENALASALARPEQKWHSADRTDVPMLAAAYAFGLVQNHPYRDGNKRIGSLLFLLYLDKNGRLLRPDGSLRFDDNVLVALALLIAESKPAERDLMVRLVLGLLEDSGATIEREPSQDP